MASTITYESIDRNYAGNYNRRCIDGSIHGCGSCKGYCNYSGHPGYLTEKMIVDKHCIEKGCHYYLSKPKAQKRITPECSDRDIMNAAANALALFEGLRVIRVKQDDAGSWILYYVEVAGYEPDTICDCISSSCDFNFSISRLPYSFDKAVQLVFGKVS